MGRMSGMEPVEQIPAKVLLLYEAVQQLVEEGVDLSDIRVSSITERAGIGKGTAYEYFDTKEEIIVCAAIFYINRMSEQMNGILADLDSLEAQVDFLFGEMDRESGRKYCFARVAHMMTDNSRFSQLMQEKLKGSAAGRSFPEYLFGQIIARGRERGQIRGDQPLEYLVYVVFCKMLTYMMCVCTGECFGTDIKKMRQLVIDGILRELKGN